MAWGRALVGGGQAGADGKGAGEARRINVLATGSVDQSVKVSRPRRGRSEADEIDMDALDGVDAASLVLMHGLERITRGSGRGVVGIQGDTESGGASSTSSNTTTLLVGQHHTEYVTMTKCYSHDTRVVSETSSVGRSHAKSMSTFPVVPSAQAIPNEVCGQIVILGIPIPLTVLGCCTRQIFRWVRSRFDCLRLRIHHRQYGFWNGAFVLEL